MGFGMPSAFVGEQTGRIFLQVARRFNQEGRGKMRTATGMTVLAILLAAAMPLSGEALPGGRTQVLRLAHKFEERAYEVLGEAVYEQRYFTRGQGEGLEAIRELTHAATYFYDRVTYERDPYRTVDDFEILAEAFSRAAWWMNRVPMNRDVQREFRKLSTTFRQLERQFGFNGRGNRVSRRQGIGNDRYHQLLRTRVIPRVQGHLKVRKGKSRVQLDVGLRLPGGRVRVIWR